MDSLFDGKTAQLRQFVPVTKNYSMTDLMPTLNATAEDLLSRFFGVDIAEQIAYLATANLQGEPVLGRALVLAQTAAAKIGYATFLPWAEIQITDVGVTVSAEEGRKAAFEYQVKRLEKQLLESGWQALDNLAKHIADHADLFPYWPESPYYAEHRTALFSTPGQFSKYYPIQDRWLTFWALRPFIRVAEEDRGHDALARIDDLPVSTAKAQIDKLRSVMLRAVAYEAVILGMPNLMIEISGANVQVNYASQYGNSTYYQPPKREDIDWVTSNLRKQADLAWATFEAQLLAANPPATPQDDASDALGIIVDDKFLFL